MSYSLANIQRLPTNTGIELVVQFSVESVDQFNAGVGWKSLDVCECIRHVSPFAYINNIACIV